MNACNTFLITQNQFECQIRHMYASPTVSPPADGSSFDQHALVVSVQMVFQVLLFLGLGAELQVYVVGELREIAKAFLSTAHTVPREAWGRSMHTEDL